MSDLDHRWPRRLASRPDLREQLLARWAEPQRGYHDTRHLTEMLDRLDLLLAQPGYGGVDADAVLLAAWFHDAVYDGRPDDVERSAALAEDTLPGSGVPEDLVAEVARLVRLTHDHRPGPDDAAGQLLCDADLAILAADAERYADYVAGVRAEYAHLDDATFAAGRATVLRSLLDRPALFGTPAARRWEAAARTNLTAELARLERAAGPGIP